MKKKRKFITVFAAIIISLVYFGYARTSAGSKDTSSDVIGSTDANDMKAVAAGNIDFALALYSKLGNDPNITSSKCNLFFSPYSISASLAMTYAGARGETKKQMAEVLHFNLPDERLHPALGDLQKQLIQEDKSRGYQLFLANHLWGQKDEPFLKEFLDLAKNYYQADFEQLDFSGETEKCRQIINSWIKSKTNYKIKECIPQNGLKPYTVLVLTNAIYFKGEWKTKFSWWKTKNADFAISVKDKVKVPLMHLKESFKYYEDEKLQAIELPYKGNEISMLVLLPHTVEGLKEIEDTLTAENLNALLSKMRMTKVDVYFPRFKMTWGTFSLNQVLIELGMPDAFDSEKANFSGMNGTGGIWISDVFHKALVEVNEEGTEAAAGTAVVMVKSIESPVIFRADHPFIFIIRDNHFGNILFIGRLINPAEQSADLKMG